MTIYKFKCFFDDSFTSEKYVVAESEEEAIAKINSFFENPGLLKPTYIDCPTVEISGVI